MHRIGIITTSHAINYGAVLQAYSLKKAIEENTNSKVDIINYCGDEGIAGRKIYRKNSNLKNVAINIISFIRFKYRRNRKRLFRLFGNFETNYLDIFGSLITTEKDLKCLKGYDVYVCGSDQLWNLNLFNDKAYFLMFVNEEISKVAYAVSISDSMTDEQMKAIADRAQDFKAISIRELDDAQRLSQFMHRHIDNLIDPVFLHDADEWTRLLSINSKKSLKYLLVFLISHQEKDQDVIDKIKGNRRVIVLNLHPIKYIVGDEELNVCSPIDFVGMIANADAIVTDSFHCTAFSIIFNKNFYNIKRLTRNNRIENLYDRFGIPARFSYSSEIPEELTDYENINLAIKQESDKGKNFIKDNIGENNDNPGF